MKTPQVAPLPGMSPLGWNPDRADFDCDRVIPPKANAELAVTNARNVDERTVAERKWQASLKPRAEQKACDAGLFSDNSKQTELF